MSSGGMTNADRAVDCFRNGFNCAQAVASTYGPLLGLDEDTCLKIACPFGGGMGRLQHVCGAVTGAFMVLGLRHGKGIGDGEERKAKSYELVRELARRFEEMNDSVICRSLLECDITTESGHQRAKEQGLFQTRCEKYVRDASIILDDMLDL
jgi:C_GCAxxG_C_C family probable redox protein